MKKDKIIDILRDDFPGAILDDYEFRDEKTLVVDKDSLVELCKFLKESEKSKFNILTDITAVDHLQSAGIFEVVYHLYSIPNNLRIRLKVPLKPEEELDSLACVWRTANWHERETFDMFGIKFKGHPDLTRILLPDDFEGHPLRKDFPLHGTVGT